MGKGERKGLNVGGVGEWGKKGVGVMGIQRLHSRDGRGFKHFVFILHDFCNRRCSAPSPAAAWE